MTVVLTTYMAARLLIGEINALQPDELAIRAILK
jgi:hypothetical protein